MSSGARYGMPYESCGISSTSTGRNAPVQNETIPPGWRLASFTRLCGAPSYRLESGRQPSRARFGRLSGVSVRVALVHMLKFVQLLRATVAHHQSAALKEIVPRRELVCPLRNAVPLMLHRLICKHGMRSLTTEACASGGHVVKTT